MDLDDRAKEFMGLPEEEDDDPLNMRGMSDMLRKVGESIMTKVSDMKETVTDQATNLAGKAQDLGEAAKTFASEQINFETPEAAVKEVSA